jgi:xanthine dehydrogenase accessory factor
MLGRAPAYVGMIGSRVRVRTVMRHLAEAGYDVERLRSVHAPVGLDIGAHTPAEIALSIMAEIVGVRRGGTGQPLAIGEKLSV